MGSGLQSGLVKQQQRRKEEDNGVNEKDDEEGVGGVQVIQSPNPRPIAVNPPPPALAALPRPGAPAPVAGAPRPPLSAPARGSTPLVPRRFLRRRNDRRSRHQTLHSANASLERAHDHHHHVLVVRLSHSHTHYFLAPNFGTLESLV